MWSDLDRSTVWAETAVSSRFLHMALTLVIDAADEALTRIGYAKIFRAVTVDRPDGRGRSQRRWHANIAQSICMEPGRLRSITEHNIA